MAFTEKEQQLIAWGKANGKSEQEVSRAIANFRAGVKTPTQPAVQEKPVGAFADMPSDIGETAGGVAKQLYGAGKNISDRLGSEQTLAEKVVGTGADIFRGVGRAAGELVLGAGKLALNPTQEKAVAEKVGEVAGKIAQSDPVQEVMARYQSLSPETKAQVDNALGYAEGLGAILTGGAAKNVATKGLEVATETAQKGATLASQATKGVLGVMKTGTEGITEATTRGLQPAALMQRVARISKGKQAAFEKTAGESVGEYLVKRGVFGDAESITNQLYKRFEQSKGAVDTEMAKLPGTYRPAGVRQALDALMERETKISSPGVPSKDLARVKELWEKSRKEGLTMAEINDAKRLYERNVKLDFMKGNVPEGVARANTVDDAIRQWQYAKAEELGLKNLKELNRETRLAKQLIDDLGRESAGSLGNNAISLTDYILLAGGDPAAISAFLVKKGASSQKVMSWVAKKLSPEATVGTPKAVNAEPTMSGYLEFLNATR